MAHRRLWVYTVCIVWAALVGCQTERRESRLDKPDSDQQIIAWQAIAQYRHSQGVYKTVCRYTLDISNRRLTIEGVEPEGPFKAVYQAGRWTGQGLSFPRAQKLPFGLVDAPLSEMVYFVFSAAAGAMPARDVEPQTDWFLGKPYQIFRLADATVGQVVLYQNPQTQRIEMVEWQDKKDSRFLAVADQWRFMPSLNRLMPAKIEIYDIRRSPADKILLAQLSFTPAP